MTENLRNYEAIRDDIKALVEETKGISFAENEFIEIRVDKYVEVMDIIPFLEKLYCLETELTELARNNVKLFLKGVELETLVRVFEMSMNREDLCDPLMILNIINLIKLYNTLEDDFFDDENIYVSSIEDLLDLKLELQSSLNKFIRQLSIYFISLFKSYNKTTYTPLDTHIPLPKIYRTIFMSTDLLTLSGIFSVSEKFSTEECVYLDNAIECIIALQSKSVVSVTLLDGFLEGLFNGDKEQ